MRPDPTGGRRRIRAAMLLVGGLVLLGMGLLFVLPHRPDSELDMSVTADLVIGAILLASGLFVLVSRPQSPTVTYPDHEASQSSSKEE